MLALEKGCNNTVAVFSIIRSRNESKSKNSRKAIF